MPALIALYFWILPWEIFFNGFKLERVITDFIFMKNPEQIWFLVTLFWIFVVRWGIDKIIEKTKIFENLIVEIIFTIAILVLGIFVGRFIDNYFQILNALRYYIYFEVGFIIRRSSRLKMGRVMELFTGKGGKITTIACYMFFLFLYEYMEINNFCFGMLLNLLGAMSSVYILNAICYFYKNIKMLNIIAENLVGVLMFHQQIIMFLVWCLYGRCNTGILIVLNFVVSLGLSLIMSIEIGKNKYIKFFVGK